MCGRFASALPPELISRLFRTSGPLPNTGPSWNIAPSQHALVVRRHPETGERRLDALRWGLVPGFVINLKAAPKPINARSETAGRSGMFREALERRRAIVPCEAFYEWKAMADGKQPYAIARADGTALALAGVWERWRGPGGEVLRTFAILTMAANAVMSMLHSRMPAVLEPESWPLWLGEVEGDVTTLFVSTAASGPDLRIWPVSRAVNRVANNGPELLHRVDDPAAPSRTDIFATEALPGPNPA